jgi:hypothetical protein
MILYLNFICRYTQVYTVVILPLKIINKERIKMTIVKSVRVELENKGFDDGLYYVIYVLYFDAEDNEISSEKCKEEGIFPLPEQVMHSEFTSYEDIFEVFAENLGVNKDNVENEYFMEY